MVKIKCPKGHKIPIVGRDKAGACNGCKREHRIRWGIENQEHITQYNKQKWKNRTPDDTKKKKVADHLSYEKHKKERQKWHKKYHAKHREEIIARVKKWQEQKS